MRSFARFLAILFLPVVIHASGYGQPAIPSDQANLIQDQLRQQAEGVLLEMTAEERNELLCSLAAYPDDVLDAVFCACRFAPLLVVENKHPTDELFNRSAAYIYAHHPEVFKALQSNPLATQVTGLYVEKYPVEAYQIIDDCRHRYGLYPEGVQAAQTSGSYQAHGMTSAAQPNIQLESESLDKASKSIDELSESADEYNKTLNELNENFEDYNENISDLNTNIDEVQESADEAEEALTGGEVEDKVNEYTSRGSFSSASSIGGGGGTSPFGASTMGSGASGFGFGRDQSLAGSSMAWNSNQLPIGQLQSQMTMGNKRLGAGFGAKQQMFGRMGGERPGGPGMMGGGKGGRGGPGGPKAPGPRRPGPP